MISIVWKIIIASVILIETMAIAFLGWRVLGLMKRVKQLQADRIELLEERAKQSNKLRLNGIEIEEAKKKNLILSALDKKMILNALNMTQYKDAINDPQTNYMIRKAYKQLKEKIKDSIKE